VSVELPFIAGCKLGSWMAFALLVFDTGNDWLWFRSVLSSPCVFTLCLCNSFNVHMFSLVLVMHFIMFRGLQRSNLDLPSSHRLPPRPLVHGTNVKSSTHLPVLLSAAHTLARFSLLPGANHRNP
jgi:hypothetical protein